MLGQSSPPDDKTSLPLRFETDQAALSQKVVLWRSTRFFWRGLGFAVLIVIGVSAHALHPVAAYGSSASSRLVPALAFSPLSLRAIHEASHPVSGHARNAAISASALEEPLAAPFSVTKQPLEWQPVPADAIISLGNEASARTAKPVQAKLMEEGSLQKNIYELRVPELKAALRERGLPVSGKKADLITRLDTNMEESLHRVQEFTSHVQPLVDSSYVIKSNEGASLPTMHPHGVDILGYPQAEEHVLELVGDDLGFQEDSAPAQTVDAYMDDAFAEPAQAGEPAAAVTEADELAFYAAADAAQSPQAEDDAEEEEEDQYFDDLASAQGHVRHQHKEQYFGEELVDSSSMERSESASLPPMQPHVGVQLQGLPQVTGVAAREEEGGKFDFKAAILLHVEAAAEILLDVQAAAERRKGMEFDLKAAVLRDTQAAADVLLEVQASAEQEGLEFDFKAAILPGVQAAAEILRDVQAAAEKEGLDFDSKAAILLDVQAAAEILLDAVQASAEKEGLDRDFTGSAIDAAVQSAGRGDAAPALESLDLAIAAAADDAAAERLWSSAGKPLLRIGKHGPKLSHATGLADLCDNQQFVCVRFTGPHTDDSLATLVELVRGRAGISLPSEAAQRRCRGALRAAGACRGRLLLRLPRGTRCGGGGQGSRGCILAGGAQGERG